MTVEYIKGDLIKLALEGRWDVIIHGVNCFHTMSNGIALQIKKTFPDAYKADLKTKRGNMNKLGTFSDAKCKVDKKPITVCNLYTQYRFGTAIQEINYRHLETSLIAIRERYWLNSIASPVIGSGSGGGNKKVILDIYEDVFKHVDITVVSKPIVFK